MEGFSHVTLVVDKIFRLGQKHWNGMKMLYKNRAKQKIILLPPVAIIIAIPMYITHNSIFKFRFIQSVLTV